MQFYMWGLPYLISPFVKRPQMRERLKGIAERLGVARPDELAGQLETITNHLSPLTSHINGLQRRRRLLFSYKTRLWRTRLRG